jgi:signal transduction histidine kinase
LFFVKVGILAVMICYLIAIIKKWYFQEKEIAVQKLESALLVEKMQNQIYCERSRIAADMHDDMGAGLSRMRYLSAAIQQKVKDENIQAELDKLISNSDELVDKMNEIIWMLNSSDGSLEETLYYIRSQCSEMLDHANINVEYDLPQSIPYRIISSDDKRNLYLLIKEAIHNAIKHSGADLVNIKCAIADTVEFTVTDNGRGFDTAAIKKTGNGLFNYKKRIGKLNGHYQLKTAPGKGTKIIFTIPFGSIS